VGEIRGWDDSNIENVSWKELKNTLLSREWRSQCLPLLGVDRIEQYSKEDVRVRGCLEHVFPFGFCRLLFDRTESATFGDILLAGKARPIDQWSSYLNKIISPYEAKMIDWARYHNGHVNSDLESPNYSKAYTARRARTQSCSVLRTSSRPK
jgi:hypothetical protein